MSRHDDRWLLRIAAWSGLLAIGMGLTLALWLHFISDAPAMLIWLPLWPVLTTSGAYYGAIVWRRRSGFLWVALVLVIVLAISTGTWIGWAPAITIALAGGCLCAAALAWADARSELLFSGSAIAAAWLGVAAALFPVSLGLIAASLWAVGMGALEILSAEWLAGWACATVAAVTVALSVIAAEEMGHRAAKRLLTATESPSADTQQ